jgi:hypothetical protein
VTGAAGVTVTVVFTPAVTLNSGAPTTAGCVANANVIDALSTTVTCPATGLTSVTVSATPLSTGSLAVVAGVISTDYDPDMTNNSMSITKTVGGPVISGIGPNLGTVAGGQTVAISGTGLLNPTSVTFGGVAAAVTLNSDTNLNVITPAHAAGPVNVTVTTAAGSATSTNAFTYVVVAVTSVSPANGSTTGGRTVTINGSGFQPAITVTFGGASATPVGTHTTSQITVTTPAHAAGAVDVQVVNAGNGGTATLTGGFTYVGPPTCTSVSISPAPPAVTGAPLTFTPVCSGGIAPLQYLYWLYNGSTFVTNSGGYITTPWTWTPSATQTGTWSVGVWVKSVDSTNQYDTIVGTGNFTINAAVDNAVVVSTSGFPSTMIPGQVATVSVTMKNTGNTTWTAATNYKLGDASPTPGQFGPTRELLTSAVPPNGQVTFTFNITAPATLGTYTYGWRMLQEMVHWFGAYAPSGGYTINVVAPVDNAVVVSTSGFQSVMNPGQVATVSVTMKNTGNTTWTAATNYKLGDASPTPGQFGPTRELLTSSVPPNGQVTFTFNITAPATVGTYTYGWQMLQEMVHWFGAYAPSPGYTITVAAPVDNAAVVSTSGIPSSMYPGEVSAISITMKNSGTTTWTPAANYKIGDASGTPGQFGPTRQLLSAAVPPNGQVTFTFNITAPTTVGTYSFGWRMLQEMVHWFGAYAPSGGYSITVAQPVSRLAWMAPGNTPGYTTWDPTPTDLIFAGTVTNVPAGTSVTLLYVPWSTNVWQSKTTTTNSAGAWFVVVPNAILTTNYSAYVTATGIVPQSNQCWSGPDVNRLTICP